MSVIYLEGRLTHPGMRYHRHIGAIQLALASGAPIIPLGTRVDPRHLKEVRFTLHGRTRSGLGSSGRRATCSSAKRGIPLMPTPTPSPMNS